MLSGLSLRATSDRIYDESDNYRLACKYAGMSNSTKRSGMAKLRKAFTTPQNSYTLIRKYSMLDFKGTKVVEGRAERCTLAAAKS